MSIAAEATVPPEPTTKMLCGASEVPPGTVTLTAIAALLVTVDGDPESTVPTVESSRYVSVSPTRKLATVPVTIAGNATIGAVESRTNDAVATVTGALFEPSAPIHDPMPACTE